MYSIFFVSQGVLLLLYFTCVALLYIFSLFNLHIVWGIFGYVDPDGKARTPRFGIFTWLVFGLTMSLNMLIETEEGFDYTLSDFEKWTKQAGFKTAKLLPLTGPSSAAIAYK
ncbi:MAG: methyltransferase [Segetibacter sp.]|nr:methyltransferase [Segetibacter sp.]